jgi:hypothetical protein
VGEAHLAANVGPNVFELLTCVEEEILERAIAKLVLLGKQVGVGPEEMITLLESGMDVVELVEYLASRRREPA